MELVLAPQRLRSGERAETRLEAERRRAAVLLLLPFPCLHALAAAAAAAAAAVAALAAAAAALAALAAALAALAALAAALAALLGQRHHQPIRALRAPEAAPAAVALHRLAHLDSEELAHDARRAHGPAATLARALVGEAAEHEGEELLLGLGLGLGLG